MPNIANSARKILCFSLILTSLSCAQGKVDPFDLNTGMSRSEIEKTMMNEPKDNKRSSSSEYNAPIPKLSKFITAAPPPAIGGDKIISFSVTEQVPLKDVLIELGRIAKIDIDVDPSISGGIIVNAKNRPLKEVIDRIATLGNLRYSYKNGVLYFERDKPYMKNYFVDYLNNTLWADVEANLTAILNSSETNSSSTSDDGSVIAATNSQASFTSNKSAGIISIYASEKQHLAAAKYLHDVQKHASAQVLIEAKVVEVTLSKDFVTGIDWSILGAQNTIVATNGYTAGQPLKYITSEIMDTDLSASVSALETFGVAKAISSPRISAMNNQKATLDFSENLIYFTISTAQSTTSSTTPATVATVTATKNEVPVGVQITITPSINLESNEVTLEVAPKLSVDSGKKVNDPSVNPNTGASLGNQVPIIKTRTLNTLAKVHSGNILVIGGLMSDSTSDTETGIPFISRVPIFGWLFKSISKSTDIVETVILIKATIINSSTPVGKEDRNLEKLDTNKRRFFKN